MKSAYLCSIPSNPETEQSDPALHEEELEEARFLNSPSKYAYEEVCYDSGIYLLLRRTQGTWYITDIVLTDAAAGFVPVFTWERIRRGAPGALRRVLPCRHNPAARPSGGEAVCL